MVSWNSLAKSAALLAVVFVLAFGLCAVSAMKDGGHGRLIGAVVPISIGIEILCLLGLLVIGILAIVRAVRGASNGGND